MSAKFVLDDSGQELAEIVARIARMDQNALAEFYDRTSSLAYGLVQRILNNPSVAEEVTIEVYMRVWRRAARYDAKRGSPRVWLCVMARSCALDSLRARKQEALEQPFGEEGEIADASTIANETLSKSIGRQMVVRSALDLLSAAQREAIELAYFFGLSHREIAAKLGQPLGTVKCHIRLGMLRLRDRLQPYGDCL